MKNLYLFTFGALLSFSASSQIVIQASELNPTIGETFTVKVADWISEGNSGNNVTWDFSAMQETGNVFSINYTAASGSFPSTNITQETVAGGQGSLAYYENSSTGQFIHGIEVPGTVITYQDAAKVLAFPLNNTVNETDNFSATFTSGGFAFVRAGTSEVFADSYGTVITPQGTFTDVIRVLVTMEYTDTYSAGTIQYISTSYSWYKAGIHYPLASISELSTDTGAPTEYSAQFLTGANLGIEDELAAQISVFPNPVSSLLNVELTNGATNVDHVDLVDLSGKIVCSQEITNNVAQIDMRDLKNGIYFASLIGENGEQLTTKKVIKD